MSSDFETPDRGTRLAQIAESLRAIAVNGLHWAETEYDRARYERALALATELLSLADTRDAAEIERAVRGDLGLRTPFVGVDAAIFDVQGRILLIQRRDNGRWGMPGGAADVGETPAEAAEREVREETGLRVRATRLVGVYDSRRVGSPDAAHLYHLVFLCDTVGGALTRTGETSGFGYFTEEAVATLALHAGHGPRIPDAFRAYRGEAPTAVFQ